MVALSSRTSLIAPQALGQEREQRPGSLSPSSESSILVLYFPKWKNRASLNTFFRIYRPCITGLFLLILGCLANLSHSWHHRRSSSEGLPQCTLKISDLSKFGHTYILPRPLSQFLGTWEFKSTQNYLARIKFSIVVHYGGQMKSYF